MARIPDRSTTNMLPPHWKVQGPKSLANGPAPRGRKSRDYEFRIITIPKGSTIAQAREALTDEAEYGRWELARTQQFFGGGKKVWLRRRVMRLAPTASPLA